MKVSGVQRFVDDVVDRGMSWKSAHNSNNTYVNIDVNDDNNDFAIIMDNSNNGDNSSHSSNGRGSNNTTCPSCHDISSIICSRCSNLYICYVVWQSLTSLLLVKDWVILWKIFLCD